MSQITTHVLDTSQGCPGQGISIRLQRMEGQGAILLGEGITNEDGRISDLLPEDELLEPGNYQMIFDTGAYFDAQGVTAFYPDVTIHFVIADASHYHVPLLLNPFGYSTYRGS